MLEHHRVSVFLRLPGPIVATSEDTRAAGTCRGWHKACFPDRVASCASPCTGLTTGLYRDGVMEPLGDHAPEALYGPVHGPLRHAISAYQERLARQVEPMVCQTWYRLTAEPIRTGCARSTAEERAMELHIDAQHTALEPELRDWITARLDALNAKETQPSLDRPEGFCRMVVMFLST